ncbi:helix-turn-helix domain-containing protein [Hathewaya limosa]|uniref:Transcriptional regulator with XRE-family HTH domain n=1 Tax=Hathewaya limosa TaxID=1536 RepID=A0ABU0JRP0_HATLI|nr:helix-turn-helix transcriptional regulator [Hathewaya limosa]MDQ0479743.1 transcriptional regulator with XRE-family HTH domain [Hathewaya limosa]
MTFGNKLKLLREHNNLTQQDLAEILKVGRPTIAGYETKGKQPDYDKLIILSNYFNVSIDYLLGKTDIKETAEKILEKTKSETIALHRNNGYDDDLPDEARKEIENFKEFIRNKYSKK